MSTEAAYIPIPRTVTPELVCEIAASATATAVIFVSPLCGTHSGRAKLKQTLREAGVPESTVRAAGLATAEPTARSPKPVGEIPVQPRRVVEITPADVGEISSTLGDLPEDEEPPAKEPPKRRRGRRTKDDA